MNVAVIGSGISGLTTAWLLQRRHTVSLFEAAPRLGGHTHTVVIRGPVGPQALDIGFMVFNHHTYPNLTRLFQLLSVPTHAADMSLSITCEECGLCYSGGSLRGLAASPKNLLRLSFLGMLGDILAFNRRARAAVAAGGVGEEESLAALLARWGLGGEVARHYLYPMAAAIWSSGTGAITQFPARALLHFLANHGLLGVTTHHQWYSVVGGASTYVQELVRPLGGRVHTGVAVRAVARHADHVRLHLGDGGSATFDAVVIATHADQALALLAEPTAEERELLGAWHYSTNRVVLHSDPSHLPPRPAAHAAWNVRQRTCSQVGEEVCVTYLLNRLQAVNSERFFLVTLNPLTPPAEDATLLTTTMHHPTMTAAALATQPHLPRLSGMHRTFFCGAYHGWGFHEDGLNSAIRVAAELGVSFP